MSSRLTSYMFPKPQTMAQKRKVSKIWTISCDRPNSETVRDRIIIICPIARPIAYSMGQIIKSVCVCLSVYLSVCEHSHGRISWSIFTKIGTDVKTPKRKNEFVHTTPSHILPHKTSILGQKVLKPMQILSNPISALNVCESPKFSRRTGNLGRWTRWWRQIFYRKWKYGRFAHAQWKMCNIALIYGRIAEIFAF